MTKCCLNCLNQIESYIIIDDNKIKLGKNRKFCLACKAYKPNGQSKQCKKCKKHFKKTMEIDGKKYPTSHRLYCLDCSAFKKKTDEESKLVCTICNQTLSRNDFYWHSKVKNSRHSSFCKFCASKKRILKNRQSKQKYVSLLGGKCQKCGYNKSLLALEFHHLENKDFQISSKLHENEDVILKELKKCELLCANCHRESHDKAI